MNRLTVALIALGIVVIGLLYVNWKYEPVGCEPVGFTNGIPAELAGRGGNK